MILFHVRHAVALLFEIFLHICQRQKLKMWYKEHIHNREHKWDE